LELTQEDGRRGLRGYRLYTRLEDAKLLYPEGWLQKGDAELYLTSTHDGREIRGTVDLTEVRYLATFDVGVAQALRELLQPQRLEVGKTDELLTTTRLNIAIKAPGAVRLRNDLANLRGSLDLELQGDLANPILLGKAEVDPGGTVQYAGNDYEVQRGSLTFNNPYRVEPEVDLVARTRLRSYEVNLNVTGVPERLDLDVTSDPPLPRLDVLSLIASGRPPAEDARPLRPGVREGEYTAETFLYGEAASALTDRVNTLFGFDKFRIDPLSEGGEAVSSVRFTVGKRLSKDWFVTYSRDPSTTEGDILEAEWQVSRQLLLVFTQNGDGSFSVDALWDRQF
jgi:translocation and assembly module TamB